VWALGQEWLPVQEWLLLPSLWFPDQEWSRQEWLTLWLWFPDQGSRRRAIDQQQ
jgi:hypothetical protein